MSEETAFVGQWGGWFVALVATIAALIPKLKKADLDDSGLALKAWQDMSARHEGEIKSCREECDGLRDRLRMLDDELAKERRERRESEDAFRDEIAALKKQLDGVHAQLIQNSRSTLTVVPATTRKEP